VSLRDRHVKALRKKAGRGFAGYPAATVAFYGPDATTATKVAVGIVVDADHGATHLRRWHSSGGDIRADHAVFEEVLEFIRAHGARSVALSDRIIGCPHEEGVDYPEEEPCPACPFWTGRNRWTGELDH
jgi:hypothetical protein